jgi:hypothetical protein
MVAVMHSEHTPAVSEAGLFTAETPGVLGEFDRQKIPQNLVISYCTTDFVSMRLKTKVVHPSTGSCSLGMSEQLRFGQSVHITGM